VSRGFACGEINQAVEVFSTKAMPSSRRTWSDLIRRCSASRAPGRGWWGSW